MRSISRAEQETVIRWDAEERIAHIDTVYPPMVAKLDKLVKECPEAYKCVRVDDVYGSKGYTVPAKYIRFGKPATEAQKAAGARLFATTTAQGSGFAENLTTDAEENDE